MIPPRKHTQTPARPVTFNAAEAAEVNSTRLMESTPKSSSSDKSSVIMSSEKPVVLDKSSRIVLITCAVDTPLPETSRDVALPVSSMPKGAPSKDKRADLE